MLEEDSDALNSARMAVSNFILEYDQAVSGGTLDAFLQKYGLINAQVSSTSDTLSEAGSEMEWLSGNITAAGSEVQKISQTFATFPTLDVDTSDVEQLNSEAESAYGNVGELGSSISGLPTFKTIFLNLFNFDKIYKNISNLSSALKDISGKKISIKVKAGLESGSKAFLGALKSLASGTLKLSIENLIAYSAFAKGGFPTAGDIFMANENGRQELVGRIGNRPAVANQDQIGDAIFKYMAAYGANNGVDATELASAIVSGLKAAGIGAVYLDGRMLSQSINRETQRTGKPAIVF